MFRFDNSFAQGLPGFYLEAAAEPASAPQLLYYNEPLAAALGLDRSGLGDAAIAAMLGGNLVPDGAQPLAFAYAGHQFGTFNLQLGDGRALLLGEHLAPDGSRHDVQLKGSGRTPFSRGGDGRAALGPVLREYLMSEAMAALGIPTTRALAVVGTGDTVLRDRALPGAVLTRTATSHLRIGTIQFFAAHGGAEAVRQLADHAIARHCPAAAAAPNPPLALLDHVIGVQCALVAQWMGVGFVHGVMNTDNMTLSGETIDYGPCAFVDAYGADVVFSSIDHGGRYAFGRQPPIMHWNLARLAEALLPAIVAVRRKDQDAAVALINAVPDRYTTAMLDVMRRKLGLLDAQDDDAALVQQLVATMEGQGIDFTRFFTGLTALAAGQGDDVMPPVLADWLAAWRQRLASGNGAMADRLAAMRAANPVVIARNHRVEAALATAVDDGDFAAFDALLAEVRDPFRPRPADDVYSLPPPADAPPHITFCGT
jgi:uncharacterized protein YdiU (UPF0061 family)